MLQHRDPHWSHYYTSLQYLCNFWHIAYLLTHCLLPSIIWSKQWLDNNIEKVTDCPIHPAWFSLKEQTESTQKSYPPHLDMTSSQKEGNRTRRCGRLSLFSPIARPLFKTGCSGKADAVSGWIFRRANSWRIKIISSSLAAGKLRSPAETIREFKNTTFNVE